jgi:hypothetical protein
VVVQRDGSRCAVQLVFDLAQSHRLLQERGKPGDKRDGFAIDFQFFLIEPGFLRRIHGILLLLFLVLLFFLFILILLFILPARAAVCRRSRVMFDRQSKIDGPLVPFSAT